MLGLLKKHCPVCGMDIERETATKRFGKYFCSEEHASRFAETKMEREREANRRENSGGGGCC